MTIKDIARESGYAVSTVSRALNNHPDVSEQAKARIGEIVAAHSFVPNNNARQLKQQQSTNVAIIVKGSFNMFFASILVQMQSLISGAGYSAVAHYIDEDEDEVFTAEQLCREKKPLGVVFLGGNVEAFETRFRGISVPCVLATTLARGVKNLSSVGIDDVAAGRQATDYLFSKGHKSIGVIGGDTSRSSISALRREGCEKSFSAHGQQLSGNWYQTANFRYPSAYRAMQRLLESCQGLSAVFCMSDIMAVGAMRAIVDAGLRVPQDISVVGFDGLELSQFCTPRLTTVRQPQEEIANTSVRLLLDSIERGSACREETLGIKLLEGESVRAL